MRKLPRREPPPVRVDKLRYELRRNTQLLDLRRIPRDNCICWDVFGYYGMRRNYRPVSDCHTGGNICAVADPDIMADRGELRFRGRTFKGEFVIVIFRRARETVAQFENMIADVERRTCRYPRGWVILPPDLNLFAEGAISPDPSREAIARYLIGKCPQFQ